MPPIVPAAPGQFDVTVYIVLQDFGRVGRAYRETDEETADKDTLIEDILNGQFQQIVRIVAFNTAEGWSRDVTEDVARDVVEAAWHRGQPVSGGTRDFVDRYSLASGV
ncbi:hypothetical protein ASD45_07895 [Pseudolabrys sp. Root1462]|uniref:hypothetical protein n=1 Tax=Pseudolabrys sp. Root1462 TaxID=1736466 RepID=UPI0007036A0A|nr:hypothetical protein [Pseudolabrys sp. Root1462]KQZ00785.1 hypothetical protein ASD45_07895 [Pseudolabrys sp. Root1462]